MTWLAQIGMFVVFGLLATPSEFPRILLPAIALGVFLIFVARPIAVWLCLIPFRFQRAETTFVAWVGLRGAVSLLLAILPLLSALADGQALFNVAFVIVLVSLIVQGWTIRPMARQLGLIIPPTLGPVEKVELELPGTASHELVVYHVVPDSPVARGERIPRWARPSLVVRKGQSMRPQYAGRIEADDHVYLFAYPRNIRLLDRLFASPAPVEQDDKDFFGAFVIDAKHTLGELAQAYGVEAPGDPAMPIGAYMRERLGGQAEVGDRVPIGYLELIVRDTDDDGAAAAIGLAVAPAPPQGAAGWPVLSSLVDVAQMVRGWAGRRLKGLRRPSSQ
jgi:cell volume regulation protein A